MFLVKPNILPTSCSAGVRYSIPVSDDTWVPLPGIGLKVPSVGLKVPSVGLKVPSVGLKVPSVGLKVPSVGLKVPSVGLKVPSVGLKVPSVGLKVPSVGLKVPSVGLKVPSVGLKVPSVGLKVPSVGLKVPSLVTLLQSTGQPHAARYEMTPFFFLVQSFLRPLCLQSTLLRLLTVLSKYSLIYCGNFTVKKKLTQKCKCMAGDTLFTKALKEHFFTHSALHQLHIKGAVYVDLHRQSQLCLTCRVALWYLSQSTYTNIL